MARAPTLYASAATATGLSVVDGEPVPAGGLPDHRVEVHAFRSSDAAGAFAAGLALAGSRNDLAWTWETGTADGNKTVIVTVLSQPRALEFVAHDETARDSDVMRASMDRIQAQRATDAERARIVTAPLREAAIAAGHAIHGFAGDWVRFGPVTAILSEGGYALSAGDGHEGDEAIRSSYEQACAPGVAYDAAERDFTAGPAATPAQAIEATRAIEASIAGAAQMRKTAWHERFMASMTMRGARLRFMRAAAEGGIRLEWHRGSQSGHAGGVKAGASEIADLVRAGWIEKDGGRAVVTAKGRAAIPDAAKAPIRARPKAAVR